MDLATYQQLALRTAQPRAFDLDYLVPMIIGETGELLGQRAKAHWHGWPTHQLHAELVSELGDVAWGTAILLHVEGITEVDMKRPSAGYPNIWGRPHNGWGSLLHKANNLHTFYSDPELKHLISPEAVSIWKSLNFFAADITGHTFEHVLRTNLSKLESRAARGVLQGQGDHR